MTVFSSFNLLHF